MKERSIINRIRVFLCILMPAAGLVFAGGALEGRAAGKAAEPQFITIHWAEWAPADFLQKLSEDFTGQTGVRVIVEQTPWETFARKYKVMLAAKSDAWDIVLGGYQDLGAMAAGGHYADLTDWIKKSGAEKGFTAGSLEAYAEYPKGSGKYYAVPCEGDALGWAYRKDLFEDPANKSAFKKKYGYDLTAPGDWQAIADIAEFFHNPAEGFYGLAVYGDIGYDSLAMFGVQVIRTFGGGLGDYAAYKVNGILNSTGSAEGIDFYRKLFILTPPAAGGAPYRKANDAFTSGIVPMACNTFAFFPVLADPALNKFAGNTGYFPCPPQKGADGKVRQFSVLGGQGASIVAYSKKKDLAFTWLEWFVKPETQIKWAELGGNTCYGPALDSDAFLNAAPYNAAYRNSLEFVEDFLAVPEYEKLAGAFLKNVGAFVFHGEGTAKTALDKCTADWEKIFKDAGYLE